MIYELLIFSMIVYAIAIVLALARALKGPTVGDQVLALDVVTYYTVVMFILISIILREPILTVTAIPLALWVYALDIYVSKYLERGELGA